jgi:Uma2 family endonuclease
MSTTAVQKSMQTTSGLPVHGKQSKHVSWEQFQKRYLNREDGYKYEWVGGEVIKTKRTMDQSQYLILRNLRCFFNQLLLGKKVTGGIEAEVETFFLKGNYRRPDISYFSEKQELLISNGHLQQIPLFVIEVISNNDQMNNVEDKMLDYQAAGVQVVWQIFPKQKVVHVYQGDQMTRCKGDQICSAAPVLPAFALPVSDIFRVPAMPTE